MGCNSSIKDPYFHSVMSERLSCFWTNIDIIKMQMQLGDGGDRGRSLSWYQHRYRLVAEKHTNMDTPPPPPFYRKHSQAEEPWQWRFRTNLEPRKKYYWGSQKGFFVPSLWEHCCTCWYTWLWQYTDTRLRGVQAPKALAFIESSCLMRKEGGLHSRAWQKPGEWVSGLTQGPRQSPRNG